MIDAQSTRGSAQGGENGYDAGKKIKGRKRHLVVDTLGLLLAVSVTAASVQDRDGAHPVVVMAMGKYPSMQTLYAFVTCRGAAGVDPAAIVSCAHRLAHILSGRRYARSGQIGPPAPAPIR